MQKNKQLTWGRKRTLILETGQMTVDERKSFLDVWDMPEEEFQRLKELYEKYGIQGIQQTRIGGIRRQEKKSQPKEKMLT